MLPHIFDDAPERTRGKIVGLYAILVSANIAVWLWALVAFQGNAFLLGTAFLAYSFGLRHAFDADHIAAIDNVTRKLIQDRKRPITVGLFFSLGHSTAVVALVLLIAPTATTLVDRYFAFKDIAGAVGAGVSAVFLLGVAGANIPVLIQVYRAFQFVRHGGSILEEDL